MKRYIALLRGINISGKNKISMPELRKGFTELGYAEVTTCLNSGNVIFSSAEEERALSNEITSMIKERFDLDIPVLIVWQEKLKELLNSAPDWWGTDQKETYDNLIFMMPPLSYEEFYNAIGGPKAEYEKAQNCEQVIFWSFRREDYQKTNWWSKTASPKIRDRITIRTANTVRKMAGM